MQVLGQCQRGIHRAFFVHFLCAFPCSIFPLRSPRTAARLSRADGAYISQLVSLRSSSPTRLCAARVLPRLSSPAHAFRLRGSVAGSWAGSCCPARSLPGFALSDTTLEGTLKMSDLLVSSPSAMTGGRWDLPSTPPSSCAARHSDTRGSVSSLPARALSLSAQARRLLRVLLQASSRCFCSAGDAEMPRADCHSGAHRCTIRTTALGWRRSAIVTWKS